MIIGCGVGDHRPAQAFVSEDDTFIKKDEGGVASTWRNQAATMQTCGTPGPRLNPSHLSQTCSV